MYRPDDKDIDHLSREAAEHYQAPGSPAWDALRQTLEKELPQEKEKKRRGFLFFFLLFAGLSLAGSAIWYGVHKNNAGTEADKIADTKSGELPAVSKSTDQPGSKTKNISSREIATAPAGTKPAGTKTTDKPVNAISPTLPEGNHLAPHAKEKNSNSLENGHAGKPEQAAASQRILQRDANTKISYHATTARIQHKNLKGKPPGKNKNPDRDEENLSSAGSINNTEEETNKNEITNNTYTVPARPDSSGAHNAVKDSASTKLTVTTNKIDSAKPATVKAKNPSKKDKAILLGLTAGFDFSTVKFTDGSNAGYNLGFMGGYQFNKHWAALTGIIYTKKNYKLNGGDYHPPKHDWVQYVDLRKVDGFCRMWELPLLARYIFNPGAKNTFFAAAGLSSYFMKEQQYDYYYKNNMGVPMVTSGHNDSTFNHVFSIVDLSVGLQKPVGKHMKLLIEPYAKIPLGGVGFGNIRLSSFGVNLTLQYKKPLKR